MKNTCNLNNGNKRASKSTGNGLSGIPTNIKNVTPKHENFKKEIFTQQFKAQKDFGRKNEKEQISYGDKLTERDLFYRNQKKQTCLQLKSYYDNKEECMKLEIRNLQTQIEHIKKKTCA